ncbi:MAG: flagellar basal body rod protein FlgC [Kiritimatiellae bacterium]|nr:flagellar basal body rod protein FlgC [Kiritimatiellia bacterium]
MSDISIAPGIGISSTGLDAESLRMKVLANNMANAQAYGPDGEPYRRREVVFAERLNDALGSSDPASALGGVKVQEIVESDMPFKVVYRPGHPYADEEGFVKMPNVNTVEEMVDMMSASRSFQANLAAVKMSKSMANEALDLLKN